MFETRVVSARQRGRVYERYGESERGEVRVFERGECKRERMMMCEKEGRVCK